MTNRDITDGLASSYQLTEVTAASGAFVMDTSGAHTLTTRPVYVRVPDEEPALADHLVGSRRAYDTQPDDAHQLDREEIVSFVQRAAWRRYKMTVEALATLYRRGSLGGLDGAADLGVLLDLLPRSDPLLAAS